MGILSLNEERSLRESAVRLARACRYEEEHAEQVQRLSLMLFDRLKPLHAIESPESRTFLEVGALLHDIGWVEGQKAHHKASLRIILESPLLDVTDRVRLMIGSIARYHRKALPKKSHTHFTSLSKTDQRSAVRLAALLRLADGLDYAHKSFVEDLRCAVTEREVIVTCYVKIPPVFISEEISEKTDLFEKVFKKKVKIRFEKIV